jgi:type II secretory pathway pseudopilin PulG
VSRRCAGFTLAELLVAGVVGGVVSTAAVVTAVRVRQSAAAVAGRALARAQLAQAAAVLAHELRGAALAAGPDDGADLREATDTAVEVRTVVGGAVACAVLPSAAGGSVVELAGAGAGVGWWSTLPRVGDVALVHDAGDPSDGDGTWRERVVVAADVAGCVAGPFDALRAPGEPRWRLTLAAPALPASVRTGAPVRVVRRRRYTLYRGGDGLWAFGMRDWDAGGPSGVQPVAGPFAPPADGGMRVVVRDRAGAAVAPGAPDAAEVEVRFVAGGWRRDALPGDSARVRVRPAGAGWAP